MKHLLNLLTAMSISLVSLSQNSGKVLGAIKDGGNQKIIDAASISLLKAKDSSIAKVAIADKGLPGSGNFCWSQ